jgi:hypothetical protein
MFAENAGMKLLNLLAHLKKKSTVVLGLEFLGHWTFFFFGITKYG